MFNICSAFCQQYPALFKLVNVPVLGDFAQADGDLPRDSVGQHCRRLAVLLTRPPLGEDGVSLCVVPPDALTPPLQNVVQV